MQTRATSVHALKAVIDSRHKKGADPLTFAIVFPYSTHNYELRYWMAAGGIHPDMDVNLVVVPPSQMVNQLETGQIDGYCVGEPWNSLAVKKGLGHTLITKYEIWNNAPEKVFGVTEEWAAQHSNTHQALLMALLEASSWMDESANRPEVASTVAPGIYVNAPENIVRMPMTGIYQYSPNTLPEALPDFNVFNRYAANFPWRSHAIWFISQMIRWGQIEENLNIRDAAEQVYRPDIYRRAAEQLGITPPASDYKSEGHHEACWTLHEGEKTIALGTDRFFDGSTFDPACPVEYLETFAIHNMSLTLKALQEKNPISLCGALSGSIGQE
jgi:nitrate/nitrite transport system substrate-binding protein